MMTYKCRTAPFSGLTGDGAKVGDFEYGAFSSIEPMTYSDIIDKIVKQATTINGMSFDDYISTAIMRAMAGTQAAMSSHTKDFQNIFVETDSGETNDSNKEKPKQTVTPKKPAIKKTKKFIIGEHYVIYPMKNRDLRREYVVKKTIYTIRDREVRILIMKQVSGSRSTKYTLNKSDCLKFHLKFEEGLEVFSMDMDWKKVKTK